MIDLSPLLAVDLYLIPNVKEITNKRGTHWFIFTLKLGMIIDDFFKSS